MHIRCAIRIKAEHAADRTFVPAFFPPLPETEEDEPFNWLADENPVSLCLVALRLIYPVANNVECL